MTIASAGGEQKANLRRSFDLRTAPYMLDLGQEPLAGTWTLRLADRVAGGGTGRLVRWSLSHRD